jgi:hypothetical protein
MRSMPRSRIATRDLVREMSLSTPAYLPGQPHSRVSRDSYPLTMPFPQTPERSFVRKRKIHAPQTIMFKVDNDVKYESHFPVSKGDDFCGDFSKR